MVETVEPGAGDPAAAGEKRRRRAVERSEAGFSATGAKAADTKGQISWALFEWGRNPYVILITIYIFSPYFSNVVVGDPVRGQALWGDINAAAGVVIAILAPFLGAVADSVGRRKPWIAGFVLVMVPCMAALWFAMPGGTGLGVPLVAAMVVVVAIAFAFTEVFHNSMLPAVAPHERIGFLSGLGLALGNAGAVLLLIFMLIAFMLPGQVSWPFVPAEPLFGIDQATHENSRISGPLAAAWLFVFTLPLLLFTPDAAGQGLPIRRAVAQGLGRVWRTVLSLKHYRNVAAYLIARMFYNDGLTAVLIFGGVYAAGIFQWQALELTIYGILLSIFAVLGGVLGGWLDDTFGSKSAIMITIGCTSLTILIGVSITPSEIFFVIPHDPAAPKLWGLPFFNTLPELVYLLNALFIAIFVTASYANSRTMLARLAPTEKMTEFFGLYALSGTATAFLGPLLVGNVTEVWQSQRAGFGSVILLLLIGFVGILFVREERAKVAD